MPPLVEELTQEEQAMLEADRTAEPQATETTETPATQTTEAEAAPETGEQPQQRPQMVPHAALHQERELRKAAEERSRLMEERTNRLLERFTQPAPAAQPQPNAGPSLPDPEKDPLGHLVARQQRNEQVLGEVIGALLGQQQQSTQANSRTQLARRAGALEQEFAATTPDYTEAYTHVITQRKAMLAAAGWTDPAEIQTMLANEAEGLAARALQLGRNPGEVVYEMAKALGYQPKGATPAAATTPTAEEQVQRIERGQQQARSVGAMRGGAAPPPAMTAQRLAGMKDAEFDTFLANATPEQMREVFGS